MTVSSLPETAPRTQHRVFWRVVFLIIAYTVIHTCMVAVVGEKRTFLFKEEMHLTPGDIGTLFLLVGLPTYLQPFLGAWSDLFPLFGYHRRSYYLLALAVYVAGYLCLAQLHVYRYAIVLGSLLIIAAGITLLAVIINATMVSVGNRTGTFGRLQSVLQLVPLIMSILFTSHLAGYVAQHWSYRATFLTAAALGLLLAPCVFLIEEKHDRPSLRTRETAEARAERLAARREERARSFAILRQTAASPSLWALTGFVFYLIITPGLNTALIFYEADVLHFSKQFIGDLGRWASAGAIAGVLAFGLLSRWMPVRAMVWGAWLMDCLTYVALMQVRSAHSAEIALFCNGVIGIVYGLCLYTLAAKVCPPGIEATIYGLFLAAIALAGNLSEKFGGFLYDYFGPHNSAHRYTIAHGWFTGLWVGFGFTVLAVVFIPFLPAWTRSAEPLRPRREPTGPETLDAAG
jgi:MFS family permease